MENYLTFFTDPYDPLVKDLYDELLKKTELLREELIEQSIKKITIRYRDSDEKEVKGLVDAIKYYPLRFENKKVPDKTVIEKHFSTIVLYFYREYEKSFHEELEYFEEEFITGKNKEEDKNHKGFVYPVTRGNHLIFRSPHEIFYFKEFIISKM